LLFKLKKDRHDIRLDWNPLLTSISEYGTSQALFSVAPVLAVEVLSSMDTHESVREKIRVYLAAGVAWVWVADPDFHVISVYRSDRQPQSPNSGEILTGDPELPGLSVSVVTLFTR
jgi:Uma2 family endonuclease